MSPVLCGVLIEIQFLIVKAVQLKIKVQPYYDHKINLITYNFYYVYVILLHFISTIIKGNICFK